MILGHIIGAMNDNGPRFGVIILRIEPGETHGAAMLADIFHLRPECALAAGERVELIGEAVQPARMARVRAATMRHEIAVRLPAHQVDDVHPQILRRRVEVDDADPIPQREGPAMLVERRAGAIQQGGVARQRFGGRRRNARNRSRRGGLRQGRRRGASHAVGQKREGESA